MANEIYITLIQSVQSETSNPMFSNSYGDDLGSVTTITNEITNGTFKDGANQTVHLMKDSDNVAGEVLMLADTIDAAEYLILPITQEVGEAYSFTFNLTQEVGGLGVITLLLTQTVAETYSITANLTQEIIGGSVIGFNLRQTVGTFYTLSLPVQQEVEAVTGILVASIQQEVITGSTLTLPLTQTVNPVAGVYTSDLFSQSQYWTSAVTLGDTNISAVTTGSLSIQMEEGTARLATVNYFPADGNIDQCDIIGLSVTIDFILNDSSGNPASTFRRFTGKVKTIAYDVTSQILTLNCTDDLQDYVDDLDREIIDALVGGYWSADVYDDVEGENWEYAQDRLLTVPRSMDRDTSGGIRVTDWAAKATPDWLLTDSHVTYQTPKVTLADKDELINKVNVELDNRFDRHYYRDVRVSWKYPRSFCKYIGASTELPSRDMVISALGGVGWDTKSLKTTPLIPSGLFKCIGDTVVPIQTTQTLATSQFAWVNPYYPDLLTAFSAIVYKEWDQNVTERADFAITAPQSINKCGELETTLTSSVVVDTPEEDLSGSDADSAETVSLSGAVNGNSCGLSGGGSLFNSADVQPDGGLGVSRIGAEDSRQPPVGSVMNSLGDYVLDNADQARYEVAVQIVMAEARVKILETHRRNFVQFSRPFLPIDVHQTVEVNATNVHARGKVQSVTELFDIESGSAVVSVRLAISKSSDESVVEQVAPGGTVVVPDRIASEDYFSDQEQPNKNVVLPTQLGNEAGKTLAYCDDKLGFSGNFHYVSLSVVREDRSLDLNADGTVSEIEALGGSVQNSVLGFNSNDQLIGDTSIIGEAFPHRLTIELDGVAEGLTDAVEVEGGDAYTTQIPDELLLIN